MARIPVITERDQVPAEGQESFDSITESRGGVRGPFSVLMNSPELAGRIGHLGAYIRFEGVLAGDDRELAIITAAREFDCAYEWAAHEPIARDEGVRPVAIEAVAERGALDDLTEEEAEIIQYGRELFNASGVSEGTFEPVKDRLGIVGVTELTATFGYYGMLACVLNAFEMLPDPADDTLPD